MERSLVRGGTISAGATVVKTFSGEPEASYALASGSPLNVPAYV
jgi:hypothetical protein